MGKIFGDLLMVPLVCTECTSVCVLAVGNVLRHQTEKCMQHIKFKRMTLRCLTVAFPLRFVKIDDGGIAFLQNHCVKVSFTFANATASEWY